jgi:hypothetical protein
MLNMYDKLDRIRQKEVVACFKALFWHLSEMTEKNHKMLQVKTVRILFEI